MPQHYYHRQPAPRQRPSSHTHRQPHTSAYMPPGANPRSLNEGQVQPMYPGVDPYYPPFQEVEASGLVPYSPGGPGGPGGNLFGGGAPVASPVPVEAPASSSGFSLANIGELKGMIDRFGGIDGIMSGIGKMQKVVGGFQQMAPMMKLVMGILPFGKGKKAVQRIKIMKSILRLAHANAVKKRLLLRANGTQLASLAVINPILRNVVPKEAKKSNFFPRRPLSLGGA